MTETISINPEEVIEGITPNKSKDTPNIDLPQKIVTEEVLKKSVESQKQLKIKKKKLVKKFQEMKESERRVTQKRKLKLRLERGVSKKRKLNDGSKKEIFEEGYMTPPVRGGLPDIPRIKLQHREVKRLNRARLDEILNPLPKFEK